AVLLLVDPVHRHLGLETAIGFQRFVGDTQFCADLRDRLHLGCAGNFDIGRHRVWVLSSESLPVRPGERESNRRATIISPSRSFRDSVLYAAHTFLPLRYQPCFWSSIARPGIARRAGL